MKDRVVILTGAGISAESGLKTFRGEDGLWEGEPVTEVATPEAFKRNPQRVQRFYNMRRKQLGQVEPNPAHRALAAWQQQNPHVTLITQNVDDLHERGGSPSVWHMHGELLRAWCLSCNASSEWRADIDQQSRCPECSATGTLRPDIVWFGEMPKLMDEIENALTRCELFIAIGTSGLVYPAAGFAQLARAYGAHLVEINLQATQASSGFDFHLRGPASRLVPAFIQSFIAADGNRGESNLVDRLAGATEALG